MNKGQFAALTVVLGLATMGGAGYIAYASTTPSSHTGASNGGGSGGGGSAAGGQGGGSNGGSVALPSAGASGSVSGKTVAQCVNGDIQVTQGASEGAAGTIEMVLVFQNTSGHSCSLYGFPGASLTGPGGKDLLDATRVHSGGTISTVVLGAGEEASASLAWSDVPNSSEPGGCAVQKAASLVITPPNFTQSTTLSNSALTDVCSGFVIYPVAKGANGSMTG